MDVQQILDQVASDAENGEIVFPTGTDTILRVQRTLEDPDCSLDQLAKQIAAEPMLAAHVVCVANSAAYNPSGREISDLRTAVARLGFRTLRSLAMAMVVRQMRGMAKEPEYRALAAGLWEHTAQVAALARAIAHRVTKQDPEAAFFAGIVHEIGGFYLISKASRFKGLLEGDLEPWHGEGEARVGRAVAKALGTPPNILDALEVMWSGYLSMPAKTLGDTLLLADELARVESPLEKLAGMGTRGLDASIEMTIGDETLSSILAEAEEEVGSLARALQS